MAQNATTALYYQSAFRLLFDRNPLLLLGLAFMGWMRAVFHAKDTMRRVRQRQQSAERKFQLVEHAFVLASGQQEASPLGLRFDCTR